MTNEELVERHKAGDIFALNELCEANKGLVGFIASKYRGTTEIDDLIQVGWEGFLKAVESYDPDKENAAQFSTWCVYYIRGHILRYLDRQPKDEKSLQEPLKDDSETTLEDNLVDPDAELAAFRSAQRQELRQELEQVMKDCLPMKQAEIVKFRVGWYGKPWTFEDIAQAFGMATREGASYNFDKALWRMKRGRWGREQKRLMKMEKLGQLRYRTEATALERLDWEGH